MANFLTIVLIGMMASSTSILEQEFGIYLDNMPTPGPAERSGAMEGPDRSIYKKYAPAGSLPPVKSENYRGPVQNNSRFDSPNPPRGSTLGGRNFRPSPTAPSRFNRPGLN